MLHLLKKARKKHNFVFFSAMETARESVAAYIEEFLRVHGTDVDAGTVDMEGIKILLNILEAGEEVVDEGSNAHDDPVQTFDSTSSVGLTLLEAFPVKYDDIVSKAAFNAFQAPARRARHCSFGTTATILAKN